MVTLRVRPTRENCHTLACITVPSASTPRAVRRVHTTQDPRRPWSRPSLMRSASLTPSLDTPAIGPPVGPP